MLKKNDLLLLVNNPDSLLDMSYNDISMYLGEQAAKMYQYNQDNPHHCYDLYTHCVYTVKYLNEIHYDDYIKNCLLTAGLFHDIGKTECAFYKNGVKHFYGHAPLSRKIADKILKDMGYSESECLRIGFYIGHHDDFISFKDIKSESVLKLVRRVIKDEKEKYNHDITIDYFIELMELCYSDAMSQSDAVYKDGRLVNSKMQKIEKTLKIKEILIKNRHLL